MRYHLQDGECGTARVPEEDQTTRASRLPARIVQRLRREAVAWDRARAVEPAREAAARLEDAEVFTVRRHAREPVSVRLDPQDIFLVKRLARRKGVPSSQLLALWIHERIVRETAREAG